MKHVFTIIFIVTLTACSSEDEENIKIQRQNFIAEFVDSCKGNLRQEVTTTDEIDHPIISVISCDDMNKKSEIYSKSRNQSAKLLNKNNEKLTNAIKNEGHQNIEVKVKGKTKINNE